MFVFVFVFFCSVVLIRQKQKLMHNKIFRWFLFLSCHAGWPRPQWNLIGLKTSVDAESCHTALLEWLRLCCSTCLQHKLLLYPLRAVDPFHCSVGSTVLNLCSLKGDFPFKHGHHEVPVQEEVGLTVRQSCRSENEKDQNWTDQCHWFTDLWFFWMCLCVHSSLKYHVNIMACEYEKHSECIEHHGVIIWYHHCNTRVIWSGNVCTELTEVVIIFWWSWVADLLYIYVGRTSRNPNHNVIS